MLKELEIKKSCWDKYKNNYSSGPYDSDQNQIIVKAIFISFENSRRQFGYRRITKDLNIQGIRVNHKKVMAVMKYYGLQPMYVKKMRTSYRRRKSNRHSTVVYPDFVQRKFSSVSERYLILYTDVTYLIWKGCRAYQSTILDGFTKEIIDYKIGYKNDLNLVLSNLSDAIIKMRETKKDLSGVIIHSDHGSQYTSHAYQDLCDSVGLIISMGKAYTCTDNIVIESFHSLLKKGTIHNNAYKTFNEYLDDVSAWNIWYNTYIKHFKILPAFRGAVY